ncbi:hypothetical protein [Dyella mobilis]|uniref:Ig-like domain (Group 3) n=1 Tax=Dyella mobilis TaxID=1849582 RepID=A0ABS2KLY3_9GAMM|nr:hypothetical protein [Dyella mobilis]MBM7132174.1 hypothetical protein [Dyella mobilis]GLQ95841.1 hypothetical protein GCM10007863_02590 [Dyella mobilis]
MAGNAPQYPAPDIPVDITKPVSHPVIKHVYDASGTELSSGMRTDDPRPTITGHGGQPGATVYIMFTQGGNSYTELGKAIVQPDGAWSVPLSADLPQGAQSSFYAMLSDGPHDFVSDPFVLNEQGLTPSPKPLGVTSIHDNGGEHHNGDTIGGGSFTISGVAAPNGYLQLFVDGQQVGTPPVDAQGHWQITSDVWLLAGNLSEGAHTLIVMQDGHASQPFEYIVSSDATAPTDPVQPVEPVQPVDPTDPVEPVEPTLPTDPVQPPAATITQVNNDGQSIHDGDTAHEGGFALTGTVVQPYTAITIYDNGQPITTTYADSNGNWNAVFGLQSAGQHQLSLDPSGADAFTVNIEAWPAPAITSANNDGHDVHSGDTIHEGGFALTGTAQPYTAVTIYDNGQPITTTYSDSNGNWNTAFGLQSAGQHQLSLDPSGANAFALNVEAWPAPAITSANNDGHDVYSGDTIHEGGFALTGTAQPYTAVTIYDNGQPMTTAYADNNGNWNAYVGFQGTGQHELSLDPSGANAFALNVEAWPAPAITSANNDGHDVYSGDTVHEGGFALTGTAQPYTTVTLYDNGRPFATVYTDNNGNWSVYFGLQGTGQHAFSLTPDGQAAFTLNVSNDTPIVDPVVPPTEPVVPTDPDQPGNPDQPTDPSLPVEPSRPAPTLDGIFVIIGDHERQEIPAGGSTDNHLLYFYGTAPAGSSVNVFDRVTGTVSLAFANEDGFWSTYAAAQLSNGHHEFYVTAVNGDTNGAIYPVDIGTGINPPIVDPVEPPTEPSQPADPTPIDPTQPTDPASLSITAIKDDAGAHHDGDKLAVNGAATLEGTAAPNTWVKILVDGRDYGLVQADTMGHWQTSFGHYGLQGDLSGGTHTVVVSQGDVASEPFEYVTAPIDLHVSLNVTADQAVYHAEGEATPGAVFQMGVYVGASVTVYEVTADQNGHWSQDLQTAPEKITINAGSNVLDTVTFDWTGSGTSPVEPIQPIEPTDPITPVDPVTPSPVHVTIDGLVDRSGDSAQDVVNGGVSHDFNPLIHGQSLPYATVSITDQLTQQVIGTVKADANGNWTLSSEILADGHYQLVASTYYYSSESFSVDVAHTNVNPLDPSLVPPANGSVTIEGVLDRGGDQVHLVEAGGAVHGGYSADSFMQVVGHADPGTLVEVFNQANGSWIGTTTTDANGIWTLRVLPSESHYDFVASPLSHPQQTTPSFSVDVISQATSPVAPLALAITAAYDHDGVLASGAISDVTQPGLQGTGTPNSVVDIYDGNHYLAQVIVGPNGHWEFSPTTWPVYSKELSAGEHSLTLHSDGQISEPFQLAVQPMSHSGESAVSLQIADLLVTHDDALFLADTRGTSHHADPATVHLDVSDLTHAQPGGAHAEIDARASHVVLHQEELSHN